MVDGEMIPEEEERHFELETVDDNNTRQEDERPPKLEEIEKNEK